MESTSETEQYSDVIQHYAQLLADHKLLYSDLDKILKEEKIPEEDLPLLKLSIDEEAQEIILLRGEQRAGKIEIFQGIIVLSLGAVLTLTAYLGLGLFAGKKAVVICIGLMGYGGYSILKGRRRLIAEKPPKPRMKRYFEK